MERSRELELIIPGLRKVAGARMASLENAIDRRSSADNKREAAEAALRSLEELRAAGEEYVRELGK